MHFGEFGGWGRSSSRRAVFIAPPHQTARFSLYLSGSQLHTAQVSERLDGMNSGIMLNMHGMPCSLAPTLLLIALLHKHLTCNADRRAKGHESAPWQHHWHANVHNMLTSASASLGSAPMAYSLPGLRFCTPPPFTPPLPPPFFARLPPFFADAKASPTSMSTSPSAACTFPRRPRCTSGFAGSSSGTRFGSTLGPAAAEASAAYRASSAFSCQSGTLRFSRRQVRVAWLRAERAPRAIVCLCGGYLNTLATVLCESTALHPTLTAGGSNHLLLLQGGPVGSSRLHASPSTGAALTHYIKALQALHGLCINNIRW